MSAYEWLMDESKEALSREEFRQIKTKTYYGTELVPRPRRLCLMNLYLHGLVTHIDLDDSIYNPYNGPKHDVVLTNPPFGTKGANQAPERDDFTITTSNKQLNFLQHVMTILKPGGRAAVVLPDNCLFSDQAADVFKILMEDCDLHTIMRLPRGTFTPYSPGVKANVIFFTKGLKTEEVWLYDCRTNIPGITKKERPLTKEHFAEFEECFGLDPNVRTGAARKHREEMGRKSERFQKYSLADIQKREYNLDIFWIKDDSLENAEDLPEPDVLAEEAITELETAVGGLKRVLVLLEENGNGKGGE